MYTNYTTTTTVPGETILVNNTISDYDFTSEHSWYLPIAIHIFLTISTLWLLFSLIHHGVKTRKWKKIETGNSEKLNAGMVYSSVLACALMCLCRFAVAFVHMSVGFKEGETELCDSLSDVTSTFYSLVLLSTAFFLWFRQRVFYTNQMLNVNYTFCVKLFSAVSIFVVIIFGLAVLIFSTVLDDHLWSNEGCSYEPDKSLVVYYWISIVFAIGFGQISLLGLFMYALKKSCSSTMRSSSNMRSVNNSKTIDSESELSNQSVSAKKKKNNQDNDFSTSNKTVYSIKEREEKDGTSKFSCILSKKICSVSVNSLKLSNDPVKVVLRKTLLFAVMSLLADILIQACSFYFVKDKHRRVVTTLFSINSFLNLLFLIFSFTRYKSMMMSPLYN